MRKVKRIAWPFRQRLPEAWVEWVANPTDQSDPTDPSDEGSAVNRFLKILWLIIMLALLGGFGYIFYQKFGKLRQVREQQIRYEKELSLLEDKVARLTREIDELTNNPAKLEKLARDKLGLAGKNEKIFIIEPTVVDNN